VSLISRLEDAVRATLREEIPRDRWITDPELAVLESRLVDLFMEYAAEHYKLVRHDPPNS
jgi:hypothetical protein